MIVKRMALVLLFIPLLLGLLAGPAGACDSTHRPKVEDREINTWFCFRDSNTAVVFVHGVLSNSLSSWHNEVRDTYWPEMIAADADTFGDAAVFLAGYHTGIATGQFGLDDAIAELKTGLTTRRNGQTKSVMEFQRVFFITHSLGGIAVRRLIVQEQELFASKQIAVVLLGSPSRGSEYASALDRLAGVLAVKNDFQKKLEWRNDWALSLHKDFRALIDTPNFKRLIGLELFEDVSVFKDSDAVEKTNWVGYMKRFFVDVAISETVFSRPVVPVESSGEYWSADNTVIAGTDHFSIAKPASPTDSVYEQVAGFFKTKFNPEESEGCGAPNGFKVLIDSRAGGPDGGLLPISVRRADEDLPGDVENDPVTPQKRNNKFEYYVPSEHPFPCNGDLFHAEVVRSSALGESELISGGAAEENMKICFKRTTDLSRSGKDYARVDCKDPAGGNCILHKPNQRGLADPCDDNSWFKLPDFDWPGFVSTANASTSGEIYWVTPSLDTIVKTPILERNGYTEFSIFADGLKEAFDATHYDFSVRVNGIRVYFDGWPPERLKRRYRGEGELSLRFALDNLNFSGANQGYDDIEVAIRLYTLSKDRKEGVKPIYTAVTRRPYAALRHFEEPFNAIMRKASADEGARFEWSATFRPSQQKDRYAIMLLSRKIDSAASDSLASAFSSVSAAKDKLQGLRLSYKDRQIRGRLHPPRPSMDAVGLTLALADKQNRIVSSFDLDTAKSICRFLVANGARLRAAGAVAADAFIFDFDPAQQGEKNFRPSIYRTCRSFAASGKKS